MSDKRKVFKCVFCGEEFVQEKSVYTNRLIPPKAHMDLRAFGAKLRFDWDAVCKSCSGHLVIILSNILSTCDKRADGLLYMKENLHVVIDAMLGER